MSWGTDSSGNPARVAPPSAGKPTGIDFDPNRFSQAIQEQGDKLRWEQAGVCPCATNDATGSANPLCPDCRGIGWEYHSPLEIRGIVDRAEARTDALERLGDYVFGSAAVTVEPVHRLNFRDRIVLLENVVSHSEVIHRQGDVDRLTFSVASTQERVLTERADGEAVSQLVTIGVTRLRLRASDRTPGAVCRLGVDFDVTEDGRVAWLSGAAPVVGGAYAITYVHHPSYLVTNWPFAARTLHVRRKRPETEHLPGPITAHMLMEARQAPNPAVNPGD